MKRALSTLAGLICAATAVFAQDLPPGVLLLSRIENHMKGELARLSTVTCLETVERQQQDPKGKMRPFDTIRLEVLTNGDQELFASPGDRKFSEQPPLNYAGSGMLGNGLFGPYLKNILLNGNATTKYVGEENAGGRMLARYDYDLNPAFSGQTIEIPEGSGAVGLKGSFWADPQSYDVLRLDLNADDIPPTLPVTELATSINYGRTLLENSLAILLPETADVRMVKTSGEIGFDQVDFTHCRVFGAESTVSFSPAGASDVASFSASSVDDTLRPLPDGLRVAVKLRTRISADTPVGTLIDGVIADEVKDKRSVVIPAGSPVRGRIRRLERYTEPFPYFVIGLEFTEVEIGGIRHIFYADLLSIESAPGVEQSLLTGGDGATARRDVSRLGSVTMLTKERIVVHELPGVATFFYRGDKLNLPQNLGTVWKTRPLKR